jgi:hypothetical protein
MSDRPAPDLPLRPELEVFRDRHGFARENFYTWLWDELTEQQWRTPAHETPIEPPVRAVEHRRVRVLPHRYANGHEGD